jgi:hypothetical protein
MMHPTGMSTIRSMRMIQRPTFVSMFCSYPQIHAVLCGSRNAEARYAFSIVVKVLPAGGTVAAFNFAKRRHVRWRLGIEPTRRWRSVPAINAALDAACPVGQHLHDASGPRMD